MTMEFARVIRTALAVCVVGLLAACAHPINLEPRELPVRSEGQLIPKKVAYVMTDADRAKQVTTPGGGGDKVSYFPYRDMEQTLRATLRSVYADVTVVKAASDLDAIREAGVAYVFKPEILTDSSSPSPFTWPPTKFTADVTCTVTDPNGAVVTNIRAIGQGAAEFDEFKSDFSLSARRAVSDAAAKLAQEIRGSQQLR
jgi:hypothetical protein